MATQTHEYSCGAAALATLIGILGTSTSELAVLSSIFGADLPRFKDTDGEWKLRALTVADLEAGARKAGFKVVSAKVPEAMAAGTALEKLKPVIARLYLHQEYLHFVVLKDIRDGWVSIADPAYGNIKLPWPQFAHAWEQGDRVLLTISRRPFDVWPKENGSKISLTRQEAEQVSLEEGVSPRDLEFSAQAIMRQHGVLLR